MTLLQIVPWWALSYLAILTVLAVCGAFLTYQEEGTASMISDLFSTICSYVFVIGYFYAPLAAYFGWFLPPMLVMSVLWEFKRAVIETAEAEKAMEKESDLTQDERSAIINLAIGVNAMIIVPSYVFGLLLCVDLVAGLWS